MRTSNIALSLACAAILAACGGDGDTPTPAVAPYPAPVTGTPAPSPSVSQCSLSARQDFVLAQLQEWYLFPSLLDTGVNKAGYSTVQDYIDALVAPARACTPITAAAARTLSLDRPSGLPDDGRRLLQPERPGTVEREVPGLF